MIRDAKTEEGLTEENFKVGPGSKREIRKGSLGCFQTLSPENGCKIGSWFRNLRLSGSDAFTTAGEFPLRCASTGSPSVFWIFPCCILTCAHSDVFSRKLRKRGRKMSEATLADISEKFRKMKRLEWRILSPRSERCFTASSSTSFRFFHLQPPPPQEKFSKNSVYWRQI